MEVDVDSQELGKSTLDRAQEIAQAEMMRRRRRLGNLTPEQESAIETLLLSTALKVSEMIEPVLNFYSQPPSVVGADSAEIDLHAMHARAGNCDQKPNDVYDSKIALLIREAQQVMAD